MYFLWVGREELPSFLPRNCYYHSVKTSSQAIKHIEKFGIPLIISFGCGSIGFARYLRAWKVDPNTFTYRVHSDEHRDQILKIMRG